MNGFFPLHLYLVYKEFRNSDRIEEIPMKILNNSYEIEKVFLIYFDRTMSTTS